MTPSSLFAAPVRITGWECVLKPSQLQKIVKTIATPTMAGVQTSSVSCRIHVREVAENYMGTGLTDAVTRPPDLWVVVDG